MINNTHLFPFPHWNKNEMRPGSLQDWPKRCQICDHKICHESNSDEIKICSYGYNYVSADRDIVIAGILVRDFSSSSKARAKNMRNERNHVIPNSMVKAAMAAVRSLEHSIQEDVTTRKREIIEDYIRTQQYKEDFLSPLRQEIKKGLSFVHDYKQINSQIRQNINFIIEDKYSGDEDLSNKLDRATPQERAIYEASKFLDEKLTVAKFLMHPEWLRMRDRCLKFQFHKMVFKYKKIYESRFMDKGMRLHVSGKSHREINANPQAVSIIPHTLLDNAAKYSPRGGNMELFFEDRNEGIRFEVTSSGPRIDPTEEEKIFQPFYRGALAREIEEEGAGYGLYLAQMVAKVQLGSEIEVFQDPARYSMENYYRTTFGVTVPYEATIL